MVNTTMHSAVLNSGSLVIKGSISTTGLSRLREETCDAQHQLPFIKQETGTFQYDSSYFNYTTNSASTSSALNQPLPGQPPLPPGMPPPHTSVPPPPTMFGHVTCQPLPAWSHWQWLPPHAAPQPQLAHQSHRDYQFTYKKDMPEKNNFVKRDRFSNNRFNVYQQRGNVMFRKINRRMQQQRYDSGQKPNETIMGHMHLSQNNTSSLANASNATKQENSHSQDKKEETVHKKNKQRKPMSVSYPSRPWNQEDAEKALKTENEYTKSVRAQSLIIKFPDHEVNKDIVKKFHPGIENIHFQTPSGPRFCFVQMKEGIDIEESIKELKKVRFGKGYLNVAKKSLRDEENPNPQEIDPYTLYIGNLPEALNVNEVKKQFPTAVRVDVGYAQKMRNTRYAFIRYNTVDESIAAYKSAHNLMWDGRSIIVRFRRQRGNSSSVEPKTNPKIKDEAAKAVAHDTDSPKQSSEKQSSQVDENEPSKPECTKINDIKSTDLVKTPTSENNQDLQIRRTSQEYTVCKSQNEPQFLTEIKEEPIDYEESNELSLEEDDENEEGELHEGNYINYDDGILGMNISPFKDLISDQSSDEDIIPEDSLNTVYTDLVNTSCDINV